MNELAAIAFFLHDYSSNPFDSPFVVPVAGCIMIACIVIAGTAAGTRKREIQSQERLAAIARGVPVPPTLEELAILHGKPSTDLTRRRANIRLGGIILVFTAFGLMAFFAALAAILQERNVLCGLAVGLIPLGIGLGMLYDVRIQTREIEEQTVSAIAPAHLG